MYVCRCVQAFVYIQKRSLHFWPTSKLVAFFTVSYLCHLPQGVLPIVTVVFCRLNTIMSSMMMNSFDEFLWEYHMPSYLYVPIKVVTPILCRSIMYVIF